MMMFGKLKIRHVAGFVAVYYATLLVWATTLAAWCFDHYPIMGWGTLAFYGTTVWLVLPVSVALIIEIRTQRMMGLQQVGK